MKPLKYLVLTIAILFIVDCSKTDRKNKVASYAQPDYATSAKDSFIPAIYFTEMTREAGIDFKHENGAFGNKWMPETIGSGLGFFDYNNDGRPDLFLVNSSHWDANKKTDLLPTQKLYQNLGGFRFKDVTKQTGLDISLYGMGCAFADYDADGDMDIYITAVGTNKLMRNDNGKFSDVTIASAVTGNSINTGDPPAWSTGSAWLDVDRDGWLDLFVCNYVKWTPETDLFTTLDGTTKTYATPEIYQGESCRLYRNIDGKKFDDITRTAGVFNPDGKSLGIAIAYLNNDNWPDIVVTNDTQPNFLYINKGDGTFEDKGLQAGIAYDEFGQARAGMGVDISDIENTGTYSIAIGNFAHEPISLFTMISPLTFQDFAGRSRISTASLRSLTFGVLFRDMDLDGYAELITTNGHIEPEINRIQQEINFMQSPQLFYNNRNGVFIEISDQVGDAFSRPIVGRGLAVADIDNDGDYDLAISENNAQAVLLKNENQKTQNHWIKFQFLGKKPNLNAIGAKIIIYAGSLKQTKMITTGSSYLSQSEISIITFGLGENTQVDSLQIRWPTSGRIDRLGPAEANNTYIINELEPELLMQ